MKQTVQLFIVALFAGAITLGGYMLLEKDETLFFEPEVTTGASFIPTNFASVGAETATDFTKAAEMTVHAVVHVKNISVSRQPTNIFEYFSGGGQPRPIVGSGSGVIISPDGYIVTNNHVIANATNLQVTLNDNRTYEAKLIGTDPTTDIALVKIEGENSGFSYIPFGDSNEAKVGERSEEHTSELQSR